ncbi:UNVERIFIED_CONTAM: hypothetical protein K2H54_051209 [Gekko kuhli]
MTASVDSAHELTRRLSDVIFPVPRAPESCQENKSDFGDSVANTSLPATEGHSRTGSPSRFTQRQILFQETRLRHKPGQRVAPKREADVGHGEQEESGARGTPQEGHQLR